MRQDDLFDNNGMPLSFSLHDYIELCINDSSTASDIISCFLIYKALHLESPITGSFEYNGKRIQVLQKRSAKYNISDKTPDIFIIPVFSDISSIPLDISKWLFFVIARKDLPDSKTCTLLQITRRNSHICFYDSLEAVINSFCEQ